MPAASTLVSTGRPFFESSRLESSAEIGPSPQDYEARLHPRRPDTAGGARECRNHHSRAARNRSRVGDVLYPSRGGAFLFARLRAPEHGSAESQVTVTPSTNSLRQSTFWINNAGGSRVTRLGRQPATKLALLIGLAFILRPFPSGAASLSGTVQDRSKAQINGAQITLWKTGIAKEIETVSAGGQYSFSGLGEGDYLIKVEQSGMGLLYGAMHLKSAESHEMNLVLVHNRTATGVLVAAADPNGIPMSSKLSKAPARVKQARVLHQVSPLTQSTTGVFSEGVNVAALIHTDGTVDNLVVLSAGSEEAAIATLLAVRKWRYSPTYLDGKPVEVATIIARALRSAVAVESL